jgi:farnesyl diphosphate synthase
MTDFQNWAGNIQKRMEQVLDGVLPSSEIAPQRLHEAMRYAVMGGGKRVRALLAHAAGELCGAKPEHMESAAAAVELIHAYSLVHDDMPCMDDDDLRRGKPSCHKQYDDATALLVGDALQSLAFQILSAPGLYTSSQRQLEMVQLLALASGSRGMAGGQAIDLDSVGKNLNQTELEYMHIQKTGALIRAAALLGANSADDSIEMDKVRAIDAYAQSIGLAFQVVDDILDAEADTTTLGKTAGKDAYTNKPTYVTILGLKRARELADELHASARDAVNDFGTSAQRLIELAQYITQRNS